MSIDDIATHDMHERVSEFCLVALPSFLSGISFFRNEKPVHELVRRHWSAIRYKITDMQWSATPSKANANFVEQLVVLCLKFHDLTLLTYVTVRRWWGSGVTRSPLPQFDQR